MCSCYIREISASGNGKQKAVINLINGVNIICGPSNTGKSYVLGCVDYIFGAKDAPFDEDTGYNIISATFVTDDGQEITIDRAVGEGKSTATVYSNLPNIEDGKYSYSKGEMSQIFLSLIGINEPHKIISTKKYKINNLTWRTFWHIFCIDEEHIFMKGTILDTPHYSTITGTLSSLRFLITGVEEFNGAQQEDPKIREAKKRAVINYINQKTSSFSEKSGELSDMLAQIPITDIEQEIQRIIQSIDENEQEIIRASKSSRALLENIYEVSQKLEEATFLRDRYKALRSQYVSDIQRLEFIINGEKTISKIPQIKTCPFCKNNIENDSQQSHLEASTGELKRIRLQLQDLQAAENDIEVEINMLDNRLHDLQDQNSSVLQLIDTQLKPCIKELKASLFMYQRSLQLQSEMEAIHQLSISMNADAFREEISDDTINEYDPKQFFSAEIVGKINEYINDMLKKSSYLDYTSGRFSLETCDLIVNGKRKSKEGKGFRAFLNTVLAFVLMKFLSLNAKYSPRFLVLDSPILSLKERGSEKATDGMKASLFSYIIQNDTFGQVIIAENEIPDIDYHKANIIRFTMNPDQGRYGFLYNIK